MSTGHPTLRERLTRLTWPERRLDDASIVIVADDGDERCIPGHAVHEVGYDGVLLHDGQRIRYGKILRLEMCRVPFYDRYAPIAPRGRVVMHCTSCNAVVSRAVVPAAVPSSPREGHALVQAGAYQLGDVEHGGIGSLLLDIDDVQLRPGDPQRRTGCCGCDGCQGPNLVCACGAEVATEFSDCLTPHFVSFDGAASWFLPTEGR